MNEERIKEILSKVRKTVGENNYKLALAITGHRPGKIRDVSMSSKDGELLLDYITNLQQENKQLKEQNEREFADYTKFKQEQYDEYLEKSNKLIKEKQHYKHIIDELEKWLKETKLKEFEKVYGKRYGKVYTQAEIIVFNMILNKLQELKGSDK